MKFSDSPSSVMRIEYGSHWPGLGHQITTLCWLLHYCQTNNVYPVVVDDSNNAYGRWADYFEPFWDETQRNGLGSRVGELPSVVNNMRNFAGCREGLFGETWESEVGRVREIFAEIFVLNGATMATIERRIEELTLPNGYSSAHIRRGDKNKQFKSYGRMSNRRVVKDLKAFMADKSVEDVFVMTDDFAIVKAMKRRSSIDVYTMCPDTSDGDPVRLRTSQGHTLDLLTELVVAERAEMHFQTVGTRVSRMVRLLRDDRNCFHIYKPDHSADVWL